MAMKHLVNVMKLALEMDETAAAVAEVVAMVTAAVAAIAHAVALAAVTAVTKSVTPAVVDWIAVEWPSQGFRRGALLPQWQRHCEVHKLQVMCSCTAPSRFLYTLQTRGLRTLCLRPRAKSCTVARRSRR